MPAELPGFYYDEQKGKYFRIQKNHVLPQQSGVHTQQSVKDAQEKKRIEVEQRRQTYRSRIGHVRRSSLASSWSYSLLEHQTGHERHPQFLIAQAFARNLSSRSAYGSNWDGKPTNNTFPASSFHIFSDGSIATTFAEPQRHFAFDGLSRNRGRLGYVYSDFSMERDEDAANRPTYAINAEIVTGFSKGLERTIVAASGGTELCLLQFQGDEQTGYQAYNFDHKSSIWDIAASPVDDIYAVATNRCLVVINYKTNSLSAKRSKAQMNVYFKDANLIISGERSGIVNFGDRRTRDSVARLRHSSAVLGTLKTKHAEQLLVHGFSSTSIYDLRFTKAVEAMPETATAPTPNPQASRRPDCHRHPPRPPISDLNHSRHNDYSSRSDPSAADRGPFSQPYINFSIPPSRYTDRYSYGRKQAYSEDLDIVVLSSSHSSSSSSSLSSPSSSLSTAATAAAATSTESEAGRGSGSNYVTLYSATTGKPLQSPALSTNSFQNPVTCLDMVRLRDGPESIVTLEGGKLLEWTMHHDYDCDHDYNHMDD